MRVSKLLRRVLGFGRDVVIVSWELEEDECRLRPNLLVTVRSRADRRRRCGRCSAVAPGYDQGGRPGGWLRRWRHLDLGFATCELTGEAPRVNCPKHGPTVAMVPGARHDTAFTRAFEDLVVWEALASNKPSAGRRHGLSWRAVNGDVRPGGHRGPRPGRPPRRAGGGVDRRGQVQERGTGAKYKNQICRSQMVQHILIC